MTSLAGKTIFITGASRGIGLNIAKRCAQDGANIVIAAKTTEPHPTLPGTIYTAAKEVEDAGGKCLPCVVDIRSEDQVQKAVQEAVNKFGGIDILINNASAISLTGTAATSMKKYDLMHSINIRGTFLCSKLALPYLKKGTNPHILNISPPLNMSPFWFKNHVAYTMAKYGMSMCALGMAEELKPDGIAVNTLWPRTAIYTAAMEMLGGADVRSKCRTPEIMSDSAYIMLTKDSKSFTGNFCIDDEVLAAEGITDLEKYSYVKGAELMPDFFLGDPESYSTSVFNAKGSAQGSAVEPIFKNIKAMISPDLLKSVNGIYAFDLKDAGTWYLDLKNSPGATGQGAPPQEAQCTMTLSPDDFAKMFAGKLVPTQAFMSGQLKIKGDLGLAMKLEKLMKQMKSHM
uniref:Hydroxysteroid dehydrogenase-like protein 2 n=1 Tax=Perinereis aibuhitensis TaxID=126650 RepID=A0A4D6EW42_PERAI|nr:hydroxysteroid dehydrogenase-like protein 2 [Perinereis aibuhitensis]